MSNDASPMRANSPSNQSFPPSPLYHWAARGKEPTDVNNATAPKCPISDCDGVFISKISQRKRPYRQCNSCGAFDGARLLTALERARQKTDKSAKKARKTAAQQREEKRIERRQATLDVPQLTTEGWSPGDWFPELKAEEQLKFYI